METDRAHIENIIVKSLSDLKFDVVDSKALPLSFSRDDWSQLINGENNKALFEELIDLGISMLFIGSAESKFSQNNNGIISARASSSLHAIQLSDNTVLFASRLPLIDKPNETLGFGLTKEKAASEALNKLAALFSSFN